MHPGLALLEQRFGPGLERNVIDLQVGSKILRLAGIFVVGPPDSRQVRFAVRQSWWRRRKVRLAIRCSRNVGRRHVDPLRAKRPAHQDEDRNESSDYYLQLESPRVAADYK